MDNIFGNILWWISLFCDSTCGDFFFFYSKYFPMQLHAFMHICEAQMWMRDRIYAESWKFTSKDTNVND